MSKILEVKDLHFHYGEIHALKGISLDVEEGEVVTLIGANGAGKTTTLRAVAGVMSFTQGTITIAGHDVRTDPVAAKAVTAFLPDNPDLYEFMSGIEYLNFIADLYGIPARQREERVGLYAGAFDLTKDLGSAIASYSHGMKQKLAIISALIRKPKLLVLDEPFVGLDPAASHLLKGYLRELCGAGGAVFFSTHVLEVAEKMCDTIAIIKDGQLVRYGPTEEVVGDSSLEDVFLGMAEKGAEA